jgi:hypothetical protein
MGSRYLPGAFPKPCNCCGARHSSERWQELPLLGRSALAGMTLEYRDCTCGSTLTVSVAAELTRGEVTDV